MEKTLTIGIAVIVPIAMETWSVVVESKMESNTFGVLVKTHVIEQRNYGKTDDTMKDGSIGDASYQKYLLLLDDIRFPIDLNHRCISVLGSDDHG